MNRKNFEEELPLTLTPFPHWEYLPNLQRQSLARETLDAANHSARVKRDGKPPLGLKKVLAQHPHIEFSEYDGEASELYIKDV